MSTSNNAPGSSSSNNNNNSLNTISLLSIYSKVTFDGTNFNDWMRNIRMTLRFDDKEYVLEKEMNEIDESKATPEEIVDYKTHCKDATKVSCIMVATMTPELQRFYEDYWTYEMCKDLIEKYHQRARQERYEIFKSLTTSKIKDGESITTHLQCMQCYVDRLLKLNMNFDEELAIDIVLHSLPSCYDHFIMTYHLNKEETTLSQLQILLRTAESGMKGKGIASTPTAAAPVMEIGQGKGKKRKAPSKQN
ncbi:uncharacterized protein LOC111907046 [Lactuca sativa]|uniref:uncharacterized protein LOC111907046 n=1 Tax=Lactuca sativa TaxID=4236 RepID=UPI000CD95E82|nr:uncharacterized protein LOC111907046 [Lactuca sativa]